MANAKHTPGPWVVSGKATINSTMRGWVASVSTVDRVANARLISAAPDMLEALRGILESMEMENPLAHKTQIDAARAAIAKAEG
jgi:hypothetical protein